MTGIRSRPTPEGWGALGLALAVVQVGVFSGNNPVILVGCLGLGVLWVDLAVGRWNLRGVDARWALPEELFAGVAARGAFVVRNGRPRGALGALEIDDGAARARIEGLAAGGEGRAAAFWRFPRRGPVALDGIELGSAWPFGLFLHHRWLDRRADLLIWPRPAPGRSEPVPSAEGEGRAAKNADPTGELRDLRPYRPGDRPRAIHAPTSARVGAPMVADRAAEGVGAVRVVVRPGHPLEGELERATGAVLDAFAAGRAVGLSLPGEPPLPPSRGSRWRRRLLDALAAVEGDR